MNEQIEIGSHAERRKNSDLRDEPLAIAACHATGGPSSRNAGESMADGCGHT